MRKAATILLMLCLMASASFGQKMQRTILTCTTGTNAVAAVSDSISSIRGPIHEIKFDAVTGETGNVSVVAVPELAILDNVTLVADVVTSSEKVYRPRFDATDTSGNLLTNDNPEPYYAYGDTVTMTVTNASATNVQFKAIIKWIKY